MIWLRGDGAMDEGRWTSSGKRDFDLQEKQNSITFQHGSRRVTVAGLHKDLNRVGFLKPLHFI